MTEPSVERSETPAARGGASEASLRGNTRAAEATWEIAGRAGPVALAVVALVALAGAPGTARAERTRRVVINTIPTGAIVYLDAKEEGPKGESPVTLDLRPGTYQVIVEKDTYDPEFAELEVPGGRGKAPVEITVQLRPAMARMRVEGAPEAATVQIDDMKPLPLADYLDGFDVGAGAHTVKVELDGKTLAEEFITVESGTEEVVNVRPAFKGGGGRGGGDGSTSVSATFDPATGRPGPVVSAGLLFDFNWRKFTYRGDDVTTDELGMSQHGPLVGVAIDVNPFRLTGVRLLHPFAIVTSIGKGFSQAVEADPSAGLDEPSTFWWRYQIGARYRIALGSVGLDLEGGYATYYYRFNGRQADVDRLPDATYKTLRAGARLGVRVGSVTPYVGAENRIVLSGGELEGRYVDNVATADASGYGFRGGLELSLWKGKLAARIEGHYAKFDWTFKNQLMSSMYQADGGTDLSYGVSTVFAYNL
jgi:hypothetical protein